MSRKEVPFQLPSYHSDFNNIQSSNIWWQHYTNTLSMALGKKSFLIRDILECQSQNGNSIVQSLPNNPRLIQWIIQSRLEQFTRDPRHWKNNNLQKELTNNQQYEHSYNQSINDTRQTLSTNSANEPISLSPLIQNWLHQSIHDGIPNSKVTGEH